MDIIYQERILILESLKHVLIDSQSLSTDMLLEIETQKHILDSKFPIEYEDAKRLVQKSTEFKKKLEDTEGIEMTVIKSNKCPLTTRLIEEEWIGVCGHSFEKAAVENFITQSPENVGCPIVGCEKILKKRR